MCMWFIDSRARSRIGITVAQRSAGTGVVGARGFGPQGSVAGARKSRFPGAFAGRGRCPRRRPARCGPPPRSRPPGDRGRAALVDELMGAGAVMPLVVEKTLTSVSRATGACAPRRRGRRDLPRAGRPRPPRHRPRSRPRRRSGRRRLVHRVKRSSQWPWISTAWLDSDMVSSRRKGAEDITAWRRKSPGRRPRPPGRPRARAATDRRCRPRAARRSAPSPRGVPVQRGGTEAQDQPQLRQRERHGVEQLVVAHQLDARDPLAQHREPRGRPPHAQAVGEGLRRQHRDPLAGGERAPGVVAVRHLDPRPGESAWIATRSPPSARRR